MKTQSVAAFVRHKLPRPTTCNECQSNRVALQHTGMMKFKRNWKWKLVWFCGACHAYVGCHEGTDIPMGTLANFQTRQARFDAHQTFDRMWKKGFMSREQAYGWMAHLLGIPLERAHIGMLDEYQCDRLIDAVKSYLDSRTNRSPWQLRKRKRSHR